ncbi:MULTISPECIES: ABC transporter ATP-binding protein [unclassified Mesorhizobium]|uniref:ABC transporter ATP-binding protein n=1 Tax=unclassified Mesorhizobium TaxID=325217 RepID=UPI0006FB5D7B|nr:MULTISPECIES: sn-glycerol-3-phosphate ABC transporter ATP-binding protein UgpC [unclassified Mesorhizobium]KQZ15157.1 ABC transporter ATP-binding protein [Mesorhizobium sp. Root1471]KQZ37665.1 ABC transporter ATP-binding protein [Mesorhizobium sp. Root554]MDR7033699.1 multiple sugar transport system ATP-binding protein [Mesorhizobium sp. BE184]
MAKLELSGIRKSFGPVEVLKGIDLTVEDGEFVAFVGPSGCGKSTLLRLICGLDEITAGQMAIDGELVNDVPPAKRGIAMVFQSYALYPHMSVAQNMGYALRLAGTPKDEIKSRVTEAARVLRLDPYLERKPRQLSGGQRQRVAIGRAIVRAPRIFLFDEPLSNLDAALRVDMRIEIARMKDDLGTTMIYVTHDQIEAMTLADRIVVLNAGKVEQIGSPLELYNKPVNRFVAGFIGSPRMNFLALKGRSADKAGIVAGGEVRLPAGLTEEPAEIGIRPEHLLLTRRGAPDSLAGKVTMTEHLGSDTYAYVALEGSSDMLVVRLAGENAVARNEPIGVHVDPKMIHVFAASGASLASAQPAALEAA